MWQQTYTPVANSLALSALVAAIPILVLLFLIGIRRKPAWMSSLAGLAATMHNAKDEHVLTLNTVYDDVLPDREAAISGA